ncbi:MAG: carboxypeptidase-like regulatory domain-containing protein [Clostridia bacterium]
MFKNILGKIADYLWSKPILEYKKEEVREDGKTYAPEEIAVGSVTYKLTDVLTHQILYLAQPQDVSGRPAILPDIKIRVLDEDGQPIKGRSVIIELNSLSGTDYLQGILQRLSDENGDVTFTNLKITRSGRYELLAKSDGQYELSLPFEITPPGLDTNFSNKPFGSTEYWDALTRKLALSKAEDEIKINEEDI